MVWGGDNAWLLIYREKFFYVYFFCFTKENRCYDNVPDFVEKKDLDFH